MEQIRQVWTTIRQWLSTLAPAHLLTISLAALFVIAVLLLLPAYFGKPDMVELYPGTTTADQQQFASSLSANNVKYENRNGSIYVSSQDLMRARSMISESGLLPNDKEILFKNILQQQSWTNSRQQNEQLFNNALENELARTIERFRGVKSAKVFIDAPAPQGLGVSVRRPTASAWALTQTGDALKQSQVDAIASLIAGSKAGLTLEQVRVVDGSSGRQRKPSADDEALPTTYLEHATRVEAVTREKVMELLSYIPGVVVAVTAQVDVTRVQTQTDSAMPLGQGTQSVPRKEDSSENTSTSASPKSAEPGVRANQTADINTGQGAEGGKSNNTQTITEYETQFGTKRETTIDPRGFPTMIAISVNVPRGFVARMLKVEKATSSPATQGATGAASGGGTGATTEPTEQEVMDAFDSRIKPTILAAVTPQVRALTAQAGKVLKDDELKSMIAQSVGVSLIPTDIPEKQAESSGILSSLASLGGGGGGGGGGSGGGILLGGGLIDKAILAMLSVGAIGMMFMLVKKSSKKVDLPSAEELVGLPPPIEGASEIVGEADEGETAMTGIEVADEQIESQKILEQVTEMVSKEPESVARMLNRWVVTDE